MILDAFFLRFLPLRLLLPLLQGRRRRRLLPLLPLRLLPLPRRRLLLPLLLLLLLRRRLLHNCVCYQTGLRMRQLMYGYFGFCTRFFPRTTHTKLGCDTSSPEACLEAKPRIIPQSQHPRYELRPKTLALFLLGTKS